MNILPLLHGVRRNKKKHLIFGARILKALDNLNNDLQGPLPPDQWQQEVISWESIALAHDQRMIVEAVTGPSDVSAQRFVQRNVTGVGDFCIDQKIKSTAYACFSVLGLAITLTVGGLVIVVSSSIESVCSFFERRRKKHTYHRLEWVTNETLQLQRMVHEELGLGTWSQAAEDIPVTEKDEKLGVLDVSNPEHPIVIRPPPDQVAGKPDDKLQSTENAVSSQTSHDTTSETSQGANSLSNSEAITGNPNGESTAEVNCPEVQQTEDGNGSGGSGGGSGDDDDERTQVSPQSHLSTASLAPALQLIHCGEKSSSTDARPADRSELPECSSSPWAPTSAPQLGN
ncbi:MAG: hypothetical protein Q9160_004469 [Pyrenula sp. 1 TL-2023]